MKRTPSSTTRSRGGPVRSRRLVAICALVSASHLAPAPAPGEPVPAELAPADLVPAEPAPTDLAPANAALAEPAAAELAPADLAWPEITRDCRPWAYNWWLGSAADPENLRKELRRYADAGMGGIHIIPIYGAKGAEARYVEYLSPAWLELLAFAVAEAGRLGLGVDMTTGTGWCFGGPNVPPERGGWRMEAKTVEVPEGKSLEEIVPREKVQAVGWSPDRSRAHLLLAEPGGRAVKRAAPGGGGPMINPFDPEAMGGYLGRFTEAFARYEGGLPRAMYHDSFEYSSSWFPGMLEAFARRRGYRLEEELAALGGDPRSDERAARVRCDYKETISDVMAEDVFPIWIRWCKDRGILTRNQAHGSPGNILDLYALADIPETEMFGRGERDPLRSGFDERFEEGDRSPLISKFASSAAHVAGRRIVAAETGTWLAEHFAETLEELKCLVDLLFASGVNHVVYHGTCYSPDDAAWPGWLFYASTQMNPRNSIWRDASQLNAYIARCQAVLQSGSPDNDVLLYWPIHDFWHSEPALVAGCGVHGRAWIEGQPVGGTARALWKRGLGFDFVSDRLLAGARVEGGKVRVPGGTYGAILVPPARRVPLKTMERLLALAEGGATVVFQDRIPDDVPGLGDLEARREALRRLIGRLVLEGAAGGPAEAAAGAPAKAAAGAPAKAAAGGPAKAAAGGPAKAAAGGPAEAAAGGPAPLSEAKVGAGRVLVGDLEAALAGAGTAREPVADHPGTILIRRRHAAGRHYFIANQGRTALAGWHALGTPARSAAVLDPLTGRAGVGRIRRGEAGRAEVLLALEPGHSIILRTFEDREVPGSPRTFRVPGDAALDLQGPWSVRFIEGGPELPGAFRTGSLGSWATGGDPARERFAGTALYATTFDAPEGSGPWILDLGRVCHSARVRLNGADLGALILDPYRVEVAELRPRENLLEIEVTNLSANRIRDLDRRKIPWRIFHDANVVDIRYRPFDASGWPIFDSGLLGPVRIHRAVEVR